MVSTMGTRDAVFNTNIRNRYATPNGVRDLYFMIFYRYAVPTGLNPMRLTFASNSRRPLSGAFLKPPALQMVAPQMAAAPAPQNVAATNATAFVDIIYV